MLSTPHILRGTESCYTQIFFKENTIVRNFIKQRAMVCANVVIECVVGIQLFTIII